MSNKNGFYDKAKESLKVSSARSFYVLAFYAIMRNFAWGYLTIEIELFSISTIFVFVFIFSLFFKLLESEKEVTDTGFPLNQ